MISRRNPKFVVVTAVCVVALWGACQVGTGQVNARLLDANEMCSQARGADPTPCDHSILTDNCVDVGNVCFNQNGNGGCTNVYCTMCSIQLDESWCSFLSPHTVRQCVDNTTAGGCGVIVNVSTCQAVNGICTCANGGNGNSKLNCDQKTSTSNKDCK